MELHIVIVSPSDGSVPDVIGCHKDSAEAWSAMEDAVKRCVCDARPDISSQPTDIDEMFAQTSRGKSLSLDGGYFTADIRSDSATIKDGDEVTQFALRSVQI